MPFRVAGVRIEGTPLADGCYWLALGGWEDIIQQIEKGVAFSVC